MATSFDVTDRAYLDTLYRMAILAEYHKPGIRNHLERIRSFTLILARGLGLASGDAEVISYASILHDIGEIGIPEVVFGKAGALSQQEWDLVKQHPRLGADMLRGSPSVILQAAEPICLSHHERWDGSGYPLGTKGESIPLGGQICGLADIFDALTTPRPYKQPVSVEEARQIILKASGTMFDPELVRVFQRQFDEIVRMHKNY